MPKRLFSGVIALVILSVLLAACAVGTTNPSSGDTMCTYQKQTANHKITVRYFEGDVECQRTVFEMIAGDEIIAREVLP